MQTSQRPGKISTWWHQFLKLRQQKGLEAAATDKPVIAAALEGSLPNSFKCDGWIAEVLPKLNHSDFCPGFDVPGDLPAEVLCTSRSRCMIQHTKHQ